MKTKLLTLVVCAFAIGAATFHALAQKPAAQKQSGADLTGTWQIQYADDDGVSKSSPKLVIVQEQDKLTGTFGDQDWPVIGAVDGSTVVFTFTAYGREGNGKAISDTVFYWGAFDGASLKGRMKNPKEAGNWIATRQ